MAALDDAEHPLTKKIHHNVGDKGSFKHKLGSVLESRWADIFILCVVMADIGLLTVEHGIDSGMFCINGERMPATTFGAGGHSPELAAPLAATLPVQMPEGSAFVVPAGYELALRPRRGAAAQPPPAHGEPNSEVAVPSPLLQPVVLPPPGDTAAAAASRIAAAYPDRVAVQGGGGDPPLSQEPELPGGEPPIEQGPEHPSTHLIQLGTQLGQLRGQNHPVEGEEMVRVCEPREGHYSHLIEHWAHILSVALLGLMFFEILLKLWVHPGEFLRNPLEVLDLFIVGVSLFIDAILLPLLMDPLSLIHI